VSIEIDNRSGAICAEVELVDLAAFALKELLVDKRAELEISLVDEAEMTRLHEEWMDEAGPTDVLSFPMDELRPNELSENDEVPVVLGDVVICPDVARKQGDTAGHGMEQELRILLVHGILHLLGFDHLEPEEEAEMFALQGKIVKDWSK
jgi:probable rRNA maturation factor